MACRGGLQLRIRNDSHIQDVLERSSAIVPDSVDFWILLQQLGSEVQRLLVELLRCFSPHNLFGERTIQHDLRVDTSEIKPDTPGSTEERCTAHLIRMYAFQPTATFSLTNAVKEHETDAENWTRVQRSSKTKYICADYPLFGGFQLVGVFRNPLDWSGSAVHSDLQTNP